MSQRPLGRVPNCFTSVTMWFISDHQQTCPNVSTVKHHDFICTDVWIYKTCDANACIILLSACPTDVTVNPASGPYNAGDVLTCKSNGFPEPSYTWTDSNGTVVSASTTTTWREGWSSLTCTATGNLTTPCSRNKTVQQNSKSSVTGVIILPASTSWQTKFTNCTITFLIIQRSKISLQKIFITFLRVLCKSDVEAMCTVV